MELTAEEMRNIESKSQELLNEVLNKSKDLQISDSKVSFFEIAHMYEKKQMIINPEYQRSFRWDNTQKTKLIESILLNIPIPPIFVVDRKDGIWELVDGVQRVSTILQFMGKLNDFKPFILEKCDFLTSLEGYQWPLNTDVSGEEDLKTQKNFPLALQMKLERARFNVIILNSQDRQMKYELFSRLNTCGSPLSTQEVRNCIMADADDNFIRYLSKSTPNLNSPGDISKYLLVPWLKKLCDQTAFQSMITISENQKNEQYDAELVLRLLACTSEEYMKTSNKNKIIKSFLTDFVTEFLIPKIQAGDQVIQILEEKFCRTMNLLKDCLFQNVEDGFKFLGYDTEKKRFGGKQGNKFSLRSFEVIAIGICSHINSYNSSDYQWLEQEIIDTFNDNREIKNGDICDGFNTLSKLGDNSSNRLDKLINYGINRFNPRNNINHK